MTHSLTKVRQIGKAEEAFDAYRAILGRRPDPFYVIDACLAELGVSLDTRRRWQWGDRGKVPKQYRLDVVEIAERLCYQLSSGDFDRFQPPLLKKRASASQSLKKKAGALAPA